MTTTAYDGLGRVVSETLPGETSGLTTQTWAYVVSCGGAGSGPQTPCVRVDETQRVNASTTVAAHAFYNGYGQVAETRDQAPGGQDVVRYAVYDASSREVRASNPYFVGAWNGSGLGYSLDDANQPGAVFTYDGLGRTLTSADPPGNVTATSHGVTCSVLGSGTGDDSCYIATNVTDANAHRSQVFSDAFGRTTYTRDLRGDGSVGAPYVAYRAVAATYDYAGNETAITQPNGSATSFTYDDAGRQLTMSDPDRGDESYAYDANSNVIQATDARTVSVYAGYDGLNRQIWRNSGDTPSGAYVTYSYDGSPFGNGLGRLTAEVFRGSPGTGASDFSGAYSYRYDARGRLLGTDQTMGGAGACPTGATGWTCQDIGTPGKAGSQSYAGDGVWTVSGGGTDIWGGNDQFRFVSQSLAGDGALSAQVASQTNTNGWAKAGLMMRASGGANNAPFYAVEVTPEQDISVQYRDTAGGVAAVQATTSGAAPIYLKIARSGVTYSAYTSTDGASWTLIPGSSRTMSALSGTVAAGLAVTAHDNTTVSTATFAQVSAPSGTVAPPASIVSYPVSASYDDAGEPLSLTYPDGAVTSTSYSQGSLGWLAGVSWTQNSLTTPVLSAVSYSGAAGAFGAITSANVGQAAGAALYHYAAQLDSDGRLVADDLVTVSTGALLYDEQLSYDPVGNVAAVTTVLPAGTDHQLFCYDEQNRLTWAGTTSGNPCGNPGSTGSFGGASYTQTFGYDTLNRLTSGPLGSYSYGDSAHLHAATSVSSGYSASYDAAGDMVCRAPSSATTCAGTPTGQQLTWDVEGRLATWQNTMTSPTVTAKYLYDGEGNRVVQQVVDSTAGSTTTTSYVGHLETYSITTGNQPTNITTTDYVSAGTVLAASVNGTLSYLATTYQGSVVAALDSTGNVGVTASQLYAPYGGIRYQNGALPTDYGYTGQRSDASTGLDYYGARSYDPTLGQFTSADTLLAGGLNRYSYVGGNPTTASDPSGHMLDSGATLISGNVFLWLCPPTYNPALMPHTSDPDEMTRARRVGLPGFDELRGALNRTSGGISLSDLPYWNQVSANRYKAAHPSKTTTPTTTPTDTATPPTQPGNDGAGAPPKEPRLPASPPSPDDDSGCDCGRIPQGLTQEQFEWLSSTARAGTAHIGSNDIVVQGSRASLTAHADSDIDLAIRVSSERFDELIAERFGTPNPGSAKFRTMEHAIATGKIQAGELGLHGFRNMLASQLGIPVDLSAVQIGGPFDNGEMIPLCHCAGKP